MKWQELIIDTYEQTLQALEEALDGLTQDDLNEQPHPDCNSMGWLTWHLTRAQDIVAAKLMGEEQLWVKDGWHAIFDRAPDPQDSGFGHSSEEVAAFKSPDVETLLKYHRAVLEQSKRCIASLSEADLDREVSGPHPNLGALLVIIINSNLQHAGQIAYLRGLLKGKGWAHL